MGSFVNLGERAILTLSGDDSLDFLQRISTNDMNALKPGETVQTVLTSEKGRIIDVISVLSLAEGRLFLAGQSKISHNLTAWIQKFIIMEDIKVADVTSQYTELVLYSLKDFPWTNPIERMPSEWLVIEERWGHEWLQRLFVPRTGDSQVTDRLLELGLSGESRESFEEFRIHHGIPKYPNELSELYNPLEADLSPMISWAKGCYIGQEVVARLDTYKKVQKRLAKLSLEDAPTDLPRLFLDTTGEVGTITSVVHVKSAGGWLGLGYVKTSRAKDGGDCYFLEVDRKVRLDVL